MSDERDSQIHISQLELMAFIGVPDEERASAQRLTFSMTICPSQPLRDLNDDIARTVNYAAVCAETKKFVESRRDRLIETMANSLALHHAWLHAFPTRRPIGAPVALTNLG